MLCPADALNYNEIYRQKSLISAFKQSRIPHVVSLQPTAQRIIYRVLRRGQKKQTVRSISPHRKINRILHDDVLLSAVRLVTEHR